MEENLEPSEVELSPAPKKAKAVEVVAIRAGFINNHRKKEGDVFMVPSMSKVGTWMRCTDPALEKEHQVMMKELPKKQLKEFLAKQAKAEAADD